VIAKVVEIIANPVKLAPGLVKLIFSRQIAVSSFKRSIYHSKRMIIKRKKATAD
jgi:hypothetical protein